MQEFYFLSARFTLAIQHTQENFYSISHLLDTVTTQRLDSDGVGVVTIVNCRQPGDYTVDQLCSHRAAGSLSTATTLLLSSH